MGKSNKKIKSDRINALRKQYDAFVEEDQKRKERNEYILGRLDKMRYSTALVPVRSKHNPLMNRPSPVFQQLAYQPEASMARDFQPSAITKSQVIPDIPINKIEDTYLIQEISKNYILIPKLRSPFMNNCIEQAPPIHNTNILQDIKDVQHLNTAGISNVKPNINENSDWMSKYEILNTLKKEETEDQAVQLTENNNHLKRSPETLSSNEIFLNDNNECVAALHDNKIIADLHSDAGYKYLEGFPEKDMPVETVNYDLKINDETNDNITGSIAHAVEPILQRNAPNLNNVSATSVNAVDDIDNKLQNTNLEYNYSDANKAQPAIENMNYIEQEQYMYTEPMDPNHLTEQVNYEEHFEPMQDANAEQNIEVTENLCENEGDLAYKPDIQAQYKCEDPEKIKYIDEQDAKTVQVINSNDLMEEINNSVPLQYSEPIEYVEHEESENTSVQELSPNIDLQMKTTADRTSEKLEVDLPRVDVVHPERNQEPEPQVPRDDVHPESNQEPQQVVTDVTEMPAKEEQLPETMGLDEYETKQQPPVYSEQPITNYQYQQGDPNAYDPSNLQNVVYPYTDEYSYDNNPQGEQYPQNPADLGENEEQTLRYDQSYMHQYVDPYEIAYEKEPEQHEESELNDQSQPEELEQLQDQQNYEKEVKDQAQVGSELDIEDGFVEQTKDANVEQAENLESTVENNDMKTT